MPQASRVLSLLVVLVLLALVGCDDAVAPRAPNACVPDAAGAAWTLETATEVGPYAVGTRQETFVDETRTTPAYGSYAGASTRSLLTSIWYPAASAGANTQIAAGGPFPVVLYSHGFSSTLTENSGLAAHLASHGYVVISPAFPVSNISAPGGASGIDIAEQPRDLSFVLDSSLAIAATTGSLLEGGLDETRVAAVGLSLGGLTTLLVTFHAELRDPRIDLAIPLAPLAGMFTSSFYETSDVPLLVMFGDADAILAYDPHATRIWERARAPVSLLRLRRGTHSGFIGLSLLFEDEPGFEHIDALGCQGLGTVGGSSSGSVDFTALLGGDAMGVGPMPTWEACPANLGTGMKPSRQLLLENAAVRAQLDAYFHADATTRGRACHFVERVLPGEDDLDLLRR